VGWDAPAADFDKSKVQTLFSPYDENIQANVDNYNNDGVTPQVRVSLLKDIDKSADYTAQVFYQGASATAKISVKSAAVATKVAIGDLGDSIANGDKDVYIPVIAYDEAGNQLSTDDLISDTNVDRIKVSVSGATADAKIMNSGDHKGTVHISNVTAPSKSVISVTLYIATANANSTATKTYTVGDVRVPTTLKFATEPAKKIVAGGFSKFAIQAIDQYGKSQDNYEFTNGNGNAATSVAQDLVTDPSGNTPSVSSSVYYYARITPINADANKVIATDSDANAVSATPFNGTPTALLNYKTYGYVTGANGVAQNTAFNQFNDTKRFATKAGATGSFGVKAELVKVDASGNETVVDTQTRTIDVASSTDSLTYSLNTVPTLFNALDSGIITDDHSYDPGPNGVVDGVPVPPATNDDLIATKASERAADTSKFAREITISAVNGAGETVAIPNRVTFVTSSNTSVAQVVYATDSNGLQKAYVIGNKAGTANVAVSFLTNDGLVKTLTTSVTVKNDPLLVSSVSWDDASYTKTDGAAFNAFDKLNVVDSYGVKYEDKANISYYNNILGITFSVSNIKGGTVTVDQYGKVVVTPDGTLMTATTGGKAYATFDLTANSASGKSATTAIKFINP
jgi:hypothetical protein